MRKFKLIKTYPSGEKLGCIVEEKMYVENGIEKKYYEGGDQPGAFSLQNIEGFPEFWEEIKEEPNYLITAFTMKGTGAHRPINADGTYGYTFPFITLKEMLEEGHDIYSVKNRAGIEMSIKDTVFYNCILNKNDCRKIPIFEIKGFVVNGNRIYAYNKGKTESIEISYLGKNKKEPIYTTTDGVDVYDGDKIYFYLLPKGEIVGKLKDCFFIGNFSQQDREVADRYLTFTSEENRDKYIKENKKPIFISSDNIEVFEPTQKLYSVAINRDFETNDNFQAGYILSIDRGVTRTWKHFVMKKNRQEYIDNNKPKYSLKEIESCYPSPTNSLLFTTFIANLKKLGK